MCHRQEKHSITHGNRAQECCSEPAIEVASMRLQGSTVVDFPEFLSAATVGRQEPLGIQLIRIGEVEIDLVFAVAIKIGNEARGACWPENLRISSGG